MSEPQVFTAESLPKALAKVKAALGPDAIILGTRTLTGGVLKSARVEITATADQPRSAAAAPSRNVSADQRGGRHEAVFTGTVATPRVASASSTAVATSKAAPRAEFRAPVATASPTGRAGVVPAIRPWNVVNSAARATDTRAPRNIDDSAVIGLDQPVIAADFERHLIENEVSEELARALLRDAFAGKPEPRKLSPAHQAELIRDAIARLITTTGGFESAEGTAQRLVLIGPAGAGKTTAIAKLAAQLRLKQGRRVALICADQHRLGASAQLRRFGELIGVEVESVGDATQMKAAVRKIEQQGPATTLIDTPGVGLREAARLARLHTLVRAARPTAIDLVLPACLSSNTQQRYGEWFADLNPSGLLLTHLDDALGFGVVLNAAARLRLKLSYLSAGQSVPKDLEAACSRKIAEVLCPPI
ncbi:MAG: hypothetical protein SF069_10740 [Phycisphaerae bacterium]|nr:hypothetical protein [Phycisphaerae bacterium]